MPERLLKEPWRLALFFTAVFGMMIVCIAVILYQQAVAYTQQEAVNRDLRKGLAVMSDLQVRSDRNNRTAWEAVDQTRRTYAAGERARQRLTALVEQEKQMNLALLAMNRSALANQRWMRAHIRRLEKRHR